MSISIGKLRGELFTKVKDHSYCYFVHSYYAEVNKFQTAQCEYILPFSAAMQHENFFAVQFHPEKSGKVAEQILRNFLDL